MADITYLEAWETTGYLSLVTDGYSRRITGHLHLNFYTDGVLKEWNMALGCRSTERQLIHHSDRDLQYCSDTYQQAHRRHGVLCCMTDGYDCCQNTLADRVNGILKNELVTTMLQDLEQAKTMVQAVQIYNYERPHTALQNKMPDAVRQASMIQNPRGNEKSRNPVNRS